MINIFVATTVIAMVSLTILAYTLHAENGELSKSVNVENTTGESILNGVSQISRGIILNVTWAAVYWTSPQGK
ncbi:hypothetical protein [Listeria booriae]|uniref:Uncharacterized protein n=1 Tax=Listeria booriae TaxID=1552123 RepID=A0A7X0TQM4_9LIST|nr:hypothetical protein [Listeria booriae]MBC1332361.1 hypothetical protein [Listeria booriae]MBC1551453.1 hypothetical protein [Listeria booriae]MBC1985428.1 hypothetical protein [Listeria booriae]MBC2021315.1 hypothetical protein [Listeria booriae]MBC2047760.1 hypothetical protein [Listeria booriae]